MMETNNNVQFSNTVIDKTQHRRLYQPGKSSIHFPLQIMNPSSSTALILTLYYISDAVSYLNVRLDSPQSDVMPFSIPASDKAGGTGTYEVAIPNDMYDSRTTSLTFELDQRNPNGAKLRLANVLIRVVPKQSEQNDSVNNSICKRCDMSHILGEIPHDSCRYCVINDKKSPKDHCYHICIVRAHAIYKGHVCDDCRQDWLQCYLCLDNSHCVHQCKVADNLDACEKPLCQKYLHACYLCGSKGHCLHKCDRMCKTCATEKKSCEECGGRRHCLHSAKYDSDVDVCHECMDTWETCTLCGDDSHCHHKTKACHNVIQSKYGWMKLIFLILGLPLFLSDVGLDLALAVNYFTLLDYVWGGLTLTFIIIPAVTMSMYSYAYKSSLGSLAFSLSRLSMNSILADLLLLLQITPVLWLIKMVMCWWDLHLSYKMRDYIRQSDERNITNDIDNIAPESTELQIEHVVFDGRPGIENVPSEIENVPSENEYIEYKAKPKQSGILNTQSEWGPRHLKTKKSYIEINDSTQPSMNEPFSDNYYALKKNFQNSSSVQIIKEIKLKTNIYDQVNGILYSTQLFEAFMENTPQTVLQLYILACNGFVASSWLQWWSVGSSLASVSWITVNHYCSLHPNEDIKFINVKLGILLPRYLFIIVSRVLAMALFASVYHWWLFVVAGGHTIIVFLYTIFVLSDIKLGICNLQTFECIGRCFLVSFTSLFCFNPRANKIHFTDDSVRPPKDMITRYRNTRNHYTVYYGFAFVINVGLTLFWWMDIPSQTAQNTEYSNATTNIRECNCTHLQMISKDYTSIIYHISMMIAIITTWALSVSFTCLYYAWFHHSLDPARKYNNRGKDHLNQHLQSIFDQENRKLASWQMFEEAPGNLTLKMTFMSQQNENKVNKLKRIKCFIINKLSFVTHVTTREKDDNDNVLTEFSQVCDGVNHHT